MAKKSKNRRDRERSTSNENNQNKQDNQNKNNYNKSNPKIYLQTPSVNITNLDDDKLLEMFIGVNDFNTTKNKSHVDSDLSGVFKGSKVKRKYRQYMNRKGGFNRTLDEVK
jgi:U4/U6.U5 tri-snRNP-associated protein 3